MLTEIPLKLVRRLQSAVAAYETGPVDRMVKAERVIMDGREYNLYPDRKS